MNSIHTATPQEDILATLEWLHPDTDGVFETRILGPATKTSQHWSGSAWGKSPVVAGYFNDKTDAARLIEQIDRSAKPKGIYVTLNPPQGALLARANNRCAVPDAATSDKDIERRTALLIDLDPVRPSGISSSDVEKAAAMAVMGEVRAFLDELGWPAPLVADSGNGYHLLYAIALPNGEPSTALVKAVLQTLAAQFDTEVVKVDTSVFNAARITKVYGTMVRKGDSTEDRPHRLSKIIECPAARVAVSRQQLEAVSGMNQPTEQAKTEHQASATKTASSNECVASGRKLDVEAYLKAHGRSALRVKQHGTSTLYVLPECVFDPSHTAGESAIGQCANGSLFYQCFHDSCTGKTWTEARRIISGEESLMPWLKSVQGEQYTGLPGSVTAERETRPGFFASLDLNQYVAANYVNTLPPELDWTFQDSMASGTLGVIVGPPGAGKSSLELILAAIVATGRPLLGEHLKPGRTGKVLVLAAEEDVRFVHRRVQRLADALYPTHVSIEGQHNINYERDPEIAAFSRNIIVVPCAGKDLRLVQTHPGGDVSSSTNFKELLELAKGIDDLALVVVDPLSRFYGADENNNTVATFFSTLLEQISKETGASTVYVHHVGKRSGSPDGKFSADAAMSPDVIRGASGLTGAARWQLNLFPLPSKEAEKKLGVTDAKLGQYLLCGVVKNNYAALTPPFYLKRGKGGVLALVEPSQGDGAPGDIFAAVQERIIKFVAEREQKGEPPLTMKLLRDTLPGKLKEEIPGASKTIVESAANFALLDEKLFLVDRKAHNNKHALYLATAPDKMPDIEQGPPSSEVVTGQVTGQGTPDGKGQNPLSGEQITEKQDITSPDRESPDSSTCPFPEPASILARDAGQLSPLKGEEEPSLDGLLPSGSSQRASHIPMESWVGRPGRSHPSPVPIRSLRKWIRMKARHVPVNAPLHREAKRTSCNVLHASKERIQ